MKEPIVFGVAGGTASGKTTVAHTILESLSTEQIAYIPHDAYYREMGHLSYDERTQLNFDHPDSLETSLMIEHVKTLLANKTAYIPVYDFTHHCRTSETVAVQPAPIIFLDGILIFTDAELREMMDIKVYVDTDADIRLIRRMKRDMEERGRTLDSIVNQYFDTVRPMHLEFVEPSKRHADIIIPNGGRNQVAMEMVVSRLKAMLAEETA